MSQLNTAQQAAVTSSKRHTCVLAGAGCGKTAVLTRRISWLIHDQGISPFAIFAVTFTNKAAREMRTRIEHFLGYSVQNLWIGTFHSLAHRLLRIHWQAAGLTENFQIIDADDQQRILKRLIKSLNLDEKNWPPRLAAWFINQQKDLGLRPQNVEHHNDQTTRTLCDLYALYEEHCQQSGLLDFAELLLRAHELLRDNPDLLAHYRNRFQHILVDEFQDSNDIQYAWIHLLAGETAHVMIVGDDDQSIYGWRGAKSGNLKQFCDDYPDTDIIRLEQNYRSTSTILNAANSLISQNQQRLGKKLWTDGEEGEPIILYSAFNEVDEANFIVGRIQRLISEDFRRSDIAILYRSNAQSRQLEDALVHNNISYRIYGGLRFFDRAEVKDALAYLRLMQNPQDSAALERIINTPPRGIGEKTIIKIREYSFQHGLSMWHGTITMLEQGELTGRAKNTVSEFIDLLRALSADLLEKELPDQVDEIIARTGLLAMYREGKSEKSISKYENLLELVNAAKSFIDDYNDPEDELTPLAAFLTQTALDAGSEKAPQETDCVQLMTLHSAKGLEFPVVFLVGLEEGIFPNHYIADSDRDIEEERRLCYVGMTRAEKKLYFTYAQMRRVHGQSHYHKPSRFIKEIPNQYFVGSSNLSAGLKSVSTVPISEELPGLSLGQRVHHRKFGEGVILGFEGRGESTRVQVQFDGYEPKWLVAAIAQLQTL